MITRQKSGLIIVGDMNVTGKLSGGNKQEIKDAANMATDSGAIPLPLSSPGTGLRLPDCPRTVVDIALECPISFLNSSTNESSPCNTYKPKSCPIISNRPGRVVTMTEMSYD
jgi:hypothetical protein